MSGKQQSEERGRDGVSHRQSQPGDNTSVLMGLSVAIICPQMFFPLPNFRFGRVEVYPELLREAGWFQVGGDPSGGDCSEATIFQASD